MSAILLILLFLFLIGIIWYATRGSGGSRSTLAPIQALEKCTGQEQRLELPMYYDNSVGEFLTKLRLGSINQSGQGQVQTIDAVVDLGSTQLLIGSEKCGDCRKNDGIWPSNMGKDVSNGQNKIIRYAGGQVSTIRPTSAYLLDYKSLPGYQQVSDKELGKQVYFGLITHSTSPDASLNVLGLADEKQGFLAQLCGEKTVLLDFPGGKLYIGNVDDLLPQGINWIPLNRPSGGGVPYVLAPIEDFRVNGVKLDESIEPKYFLIDNGATDTIVPPELRQYFENARNVEAIFTINGQQGPSVGFIVPNNSIQYDTLPIPRTILLGNQWMRQYRYVVQYDKKRQAFF